MYCIEQIISILLNVFTKEKQLNIGLVNTIRIATKALINSVKLVRELKLVVKLKEKNLPQSGGEVERC